jgi:hypothetical protein
VLCTYYDCNNEEENRGKKKKGKTEATAGEGGKIKLPFDDEFLLF